MTGLSNGASGSALQTAWSISEQVTVRSRAGEYPITLTMDSEVARAILASGEPANAEVELPTRLVIEDGKEIVRDSDGRPQAIVERLIATSTWIAAGV